MSTKIAIDDLVKKLMPDDEMPADLQSMYGFIGNHESEDHITLYLDIHLRRSLSIRKEDILHSVKVTKSQNPLGGTLIWVTNGSIYMQYGSIEQKEAADEAAANNPYLQGNIYQNYAAQQYGGPTTNPQYCPQPEQEPENETDADEASEEA